MNLLTILPSNCRPLLLAMVVLGLPTFVAATDSEPSSFDRDIRPILASHCFSCHGPDQKLRKGGLRLDVDHDLYNNRDGLRILVRGKPRESQLFQRLRHADPRKRMPPATANKNLTEAQIKLVERWIAEGAAYQGHWAFQPVVNPIVPEVANQTWPRNVIDRFVLARLERERLEPSAPADPRTLLRRLSFDFTGLPPTPDDVDAFVRNPDTAAYDAQVDRFLASPHFGERLAVYWLDLVRYADTWGYHGDQERVIYPYRDYVIDAFNANMPFDQFTLEQLGGDLLPNATMAQKVASGYNRLLQNTFEGGAQYLEYQAIYDADRVRNFSTVWLGLTLGCAQCHDHKFDPFSTREFYQLAAFFGDMEDKESQGNDHTALPTPEFEAQLNQLDLEIARLSQATPAAASRPETPTAGPWFTISLVLVALFTLACIGGRRWHLLAPFGQKLSSTTFLRVALVLPTFCLIVLLLWMHCLPEVLRSEAIPPNIIELLKTDPAERTPEQKAELLRLFNLVGTKEGAEKRLAELKVQREVLFKSVPTTLVAKAKPPRITRVLTRGNWLDDSGEIVHPATPSALPRLTLHSKERPNRLDLARWLLAPENPLVARVFVNRLWALYFGAGLVKSLDDFGVQATPPSHPELLDWLALEFRSSGWNVKHVVKLMVRSQAYRQTSQPREDLRERDPNNRLLARQARFRLGAEFIRDQALSNSGLLVSKVGGPSIKPYQPSDYLSLLSYPDREWHKSIGPNQYRRGIYTHWQRTYLHPSLLAFDAPSREECVVERPHSNTPQQALVLLNDPTFVEAARALAARTLRERATRDDRLLFAFRAVLQRPPQPEEKALLEGLLAQHLIQYRQDPDAARDVLKNGDSSPRESVDLAELAAWTSVTRVLLNLNESITRY